MLFPEENAVRITSKNVQTDICFKNLSSIQMWCVLDGILLISQTI